MNSIIAIKEVIEQSKENEDQDKIWEKIGKFLFVLFSRLNLCCNN